MGLSAEPSRNAVPTPQGEKLFLKVGARLPALLANIFAPDGSPASLPGTVTFRMREFFTRTIVIDAGAVTIEDPATARVRYDWQAGDTDVAAEYEAWFVHTDASGRSEFFPNQGSFKVRVEP